jgi:6-phosphogluconolactonase
VQHAGSSVNRQRQEGPHAHSVNLDLTNRFALVCDLGLDRVLVYRFDSQRGGLTANDPPAAEVSPGSGPRHFAFHPGGQFAYVINELASAVTAFTWDAAIGRLSEFQTISTLPNGAADPQNSTAEVQVHSSGRFLYGSNRGHDSIAMFAIDQSSGRLTSLGQQPSGGRTPRNFGIDRTGNWLLAAHQHSNTVRVFRIDPASGKLQPTDHTVEVPTPVCVKFLG